MLPLDALSLAANVAQFLEIGISLVSKTIELRRDGALKDHAAIDIINRDLIAMVQKLQKGLPHGVLTEDEQAMRILCQKCIEVSQQLQTVLKSLELGKESGIWKHSIKKAYMAMRSKKKLDKLKEQLEKYMEQLDRQVLVGLRARLDWVSLEQSAEFSRLDQTTQLILRRLQGESRKLEAKLDEVLKSDETLCNAIAQSNRSNLLDHANTRSAISKQMEDQIGTTAARHDSVVEHIDEAHNGILEALNTTAAENRAEHEITRAEIQRIADLKLEEIRSEVCQNKSFIEGSPIIPVTRVGIVSPVDLKTLQEWNIVKLGVWFGADLVLTCIQGFLRTFSDVQVSKEESPVLDPRPNFDERLCLHYPIITGNIPMINHLIEEASVSVNDMYFWLDLVEGQDDRKANTGWIERARWHLLDVLANSHFYGGGVRRERVFLRPLITAITSDPAHCVAVVRLLLEHGADPSLSDDAGKLPMEYARNLRVDGQTKRQLISLLHVYEQSSSFPLPSPQTSRSRSL